MTDKNRNLTVAEALSSVSGVPVNDIHGIWAQVKENAAKLANCSGHRFVRDDFSGDKYRCTVCHGIVNNRDYVWYQRGLEHGRKGA